MSGPWEDFSPSTNSDSKPWEDFTSGGAEFADTIEQKTHPEVSYADRLMVKNLSSSPEAGISYLKKKHPKLEFSNKDGEIIVRSPGSQKWNVLDPKGFDLGDVGDIGYDVAAGVGSSLATILGATGGAAAGLGVGSIPGAMAGGASAGAASSAALEHLRQRLGQWAGMEDNINNTDTLIAAGAGGLSPVLLGTGATVAKTGAKTLAERMATKAFGQSAVEKAAEKSASQGLLGKAYEGVTRKVVPGIAQLTTGIDAENYVNYVKNQAKFDELSQNVGANLSEMAGRTGEDIVSSATELRKLLGDKLGAARKGLTDIDVSGIKNLIKERKAEILAQRNPDLEDVQALDDIYSELFHFKTPGSKDVERIGAEDIFGKIKAVNEEAANTLKGLKERKAQLEADILQDPTGINLRAGMQGVQSPYTELSQLDSQIAQIEKIYGGRTSSLEAELKNLPARELEDKVDFQTATELRKKFDQMAKFYQSNSKGARMRQDLQVGKEANRILREQEASLSDGATKDLGRQYREALGIEAQLRDKLSSVVKDTGERVYGKSLSNLEKLGEGADSSALISDLVRSLDTSRAASGLKANDLSPQLRDILTLRDLGKPSLFQGLNKDMPIPVRTLGMGAAGGALGAMAGGPESRGTGSTAGMLAAVAALNPKTMKYALKKAYNLEKKVGSKTPKAVKDAANQNALLQAIINANN